MAERKTKVALIGEMVEGFEVPIKESTERWSDVVLDDGTLMKVKISILSAVRIQDRYDQQGNPMYVLNMAPTMAIVETPQHLRKKVN